MEETNKLSFLELTKLLEEKGFTNDRGWTKKQEGLGFYSFGKGKFRVEIHTDWNIKYDSYSPLFVQIKDCEKELYLDGGYIGWVGQNVLISLRKPLTKILFDNLLEHFEIE